MLQLLDALGVVAKTDELDPYLLLRRVQLYERSHQRFNWLACIGMRLPDCIREDIDAQPFPYPSFRSP